MFTPTHEPIQCTCGVGKFWPEILEIVLIKGLVIIIGLETIHYGLLTTTHTIIYTTSIMAWPSQGFV